MKNNEILIWYIVIMTAVGFIGIKVFGSPSGFIEFLIIVWIISAIVWGYNRDSDSQNDNEDQSSKSRKEDEEGMFNTFLAILFLFIYIIFVVKFLRIEMFSDAGILLISPACLMVYVYIKKIKK